MNTSMIGMITALLSIHYIFRQISLDSYWFRPTTKERVIRVCLSNLLVVIGLAGEFWVSKMQNSLDQLGIRIIFVNGIMLVFVYAISLAILPRILFQRIHKSQKRRMYSFVSLEKSKFQSKRNQDANLSEGVDKKDAMVIFFYKSKQRVLKLVVAHIRILSSSNKMKIINVIIKVNSPKI